MIMKTMPIRLTVLIAVLACLSVVCSVTGLTEPPRVVSLPPTETEREIRKNGSPNTPAPTFIPRRVYVFGDHLFRVGGLLFLSATFAGLTMGIMGFDSFSLEIIAESGPKPDCDYAEDILPLRRYGHQTLCTLIIANMLANVLIVQEMNDLQESFYAVIKHGPQKHYVDEDNGEALTGFIVSTLLILIFTEVLPMSLCKSKHALMIASMGLPIVRIAMVITFPFAMPLGRFLDWLIPHGAGQIYDRNELKKLMKVHCESHGDKSGLVKTELNLLLAAMEFHEKSVKQVMTPIERVFYIHLDDEITPEFLERLWSTGRSRVPVATAAGHFCDVLLVRDLITFSKGPPGTVCHGVPSTVRDILAVKTRNIPTVNENMPLPQLLLFFQRVNSHMAIVHRDNSAAMNKGVLTADGEDTPTPPPEGKQYLELPRSPAGSPTYSMSESKNFSTLASSTSPQSASRTTVGIITLEDVVEELIREEIYDEYDSDNNVEEEDDPFAKKETSHHDMPAGGSMLHLQTNFVQQNSKLIPKPPKKRPRVNFYSYFVHAHEDLSLSEGQVWALAYYLVDMCPLFATWKVGCVKFLLDEVGDVQLRPQFPESESSCSSDEELSPDSSIRLERSTSKAKWTPKLGNVAAAAHAEDHHHHHHRKPLFGKQQSVSGNMPLRLPTVDVDGDRPCAIGAAWQEENHRRFAETAASESMVLYRNGQPSSSLTIVLSGSVDVLVGHDGFVTQVRSFRFLGEEALLSNFYVPEFTAVVRVPTRLVIIPRDRYDRVAAMAASHRTAMVRQASKTMIGAARLTSHSASCQNIPLIVTHADPDEPSSAPGNLRKKAAYGTFADKM